MKKGFNGQWVPLARVGAAVDSTGKRHDLTADFLLQSSTNYMAQLDQHEAPAGPGHPSTTSPAYGWLSETRFLDGTLEGRFTDVVPEFEQAVRDGLLKKRSTEFYESHPVLRGPTIKRVGFLGAMPPGVKGLRDIQFSEEGEYFALEENFNLQENEMGQFADADVEKVTEGVFEKFKNFFKPAEAEPGKPAEAPAATAFNEEAVKTLIQESVTAVETKFTEQIAEKDTQIAELESKINGQLAGSKRAEIVSFVEAIPAEKGRHFLKRAGVVEFMESLAVADAADSEKAISFSEGTGDERQDHKLSRLEWAKTLFSSLPNFVEFGEKFGDITATAEADAMVDPQRIEDLTGKMGVSKKAGGEK